jgi:hypothetical protein
MTTSDSSHCNCCINKSFVCEANLPLHLRLPTPIGESRAEIISRQVNSINSSIAIAQQLALLDSALNKVKDLVEQCHTDKQEWTTVMQDFQYKHEVVNDKLGELNAWKLEYRGFGKQVVLPIRLQAILSPEKPLAEASSTETLADVPLDPVVPLMEQLGKVNSLHEELPHPKLIQIESIVAGSNATLLDQLSPQFETSEATFISPTSKPIKRVKFAEEADVYGEEYEEEIEAR